MLFVDAEKFCPLMDFPNTNPAHSPILLVHFLATDACRIVIWVSRGHSIFARVPIKQLKADNGPFGVHSFKNFACLQQSLLNTIVFF